MVLTLPMKTLFFISLSFCLRLCHNFTLKYVIVSFEEMDSRLHYCRITWFVPKHMNYYRAKEP